MTTTKDSKLLNIYIPAGLFLLGFCWKLFFINERDISLDEPFSIFNAQRSVGEILRIPAEGEPNPPLFMLLLHFWIKLFGNESYAVRVLPLIFNSATILFIYYTGKRFFSLWTGLLASGLFIFSTYHFFHGLEVRTYALFSLATAASLYYYLLYVTEPENKKALYALIFSNLLLVYAHYFGWFVIFSQFISGLIYVRNLKSFFRIQIPTIATVIGFLPMMQVVIAQFEKSSRGTWLQPPVPADFKIQLQLLLNDKEVYRILPYIIAIGVIFTLIAVFRKRWQGFNIGLITLFIWWLLPYSIMFLVSQKLPMFNSRYILFNTIGLYLFIGALVSFLYQKNKYMEPLAGLLILFFMFQYMKILPKDFGYREVENSVDFVKKYEKARDERIIIIYPVWADLPFTYYYDRDLFNKPDNFYRECSNNRIFRVWGLSEVKKVLALESDKRVIVFMEGRATNKEEQFFEYLDTAYVSIEKRFFPQTYHVGVYDPKMLNK